MAFICLFQFYDLKAHFCSNVIAFILSFCTSANQILQNTFFKSHSAYLLLKSLFKISTEFNLNFFRIIKIYNMAVCTLLVWYVYGFNENL